MKAYLRPTRSPMRPKNKRAEWPYGKPDEEGRQIGDISKQLIARRIEFGR